NLGTIEAGGDGAVYASGINNFGVLKVTGTGLLEVKSDSLSGTAQIDGTGSVNNETGVITGNIATLQLDPTNDGAPLYINVSFGSGSSGLLSLPNSLQYPSYYTIYTGVISGF